MKINFSIVVPIYNSSKFLSDCIDSVVKLDYDKWELILVDDGSCDNSFDICKSYSNLFPEKIHSFHKINEGQLATRLFGISKCSGDYVMFLDSDDFLEKNTLSLLNDYLNKYDNIDLLIFGIKKISGNIVLSLNNEIDTIIIENKSKLFEKCLCNNIYNSMCIKAVKRDLLNNDQTDYTSFYGVRQGEDLLESLWVFSNSKRTLFIKDALYNYRMNENSVSHSISYSNYVVNNSVREYIYNYLINNNIFDKNQWIKYRSYCFKLFISKVKKIIRFNVPIKNKIRLIKKEKTCMFYKTLKGKKHIGFIDMMIYLFVLIL